MYQLITEFKNYSGLFPRHCLTSFGGNFDKRLLLILMLDGVRNCDELGFMYEVPKEYIFKITSTYFSGMLAL